MEQCQEISPLTRQQCRNKVYSITKTGDTEEILCRLHFSFRLNEPLFREFNSYPVDTQNISNMQLLYDLHDRTKP